MKNGTDYTTSMADFREDPEAAVNSAVTAINKLLKNNGMAQIVMSDEPSFDGSDTYGWVYSLKKFTTKELKEEFLEKDEE